MGEEKSSPFLFSRSHFSIGGDIMSYKRNNHTLIFYVVTAALFLNCQNPSDANKDNSKISGVLYNENGSRAAGAKVACIPRNHNPYDSSNSGGDSTTTDDTGAYKFEIMPADTYNVLAQGDSGMAYRDPVIVTNDRNTHVPHDTLRHAGSIRGVVRLEEGGDPRTIFILFMGTRTFTYSDDSFGNFTSGYMARGKYRVRVLTTTPDYLPLDDTFDVRAGMDDVLPDTIELQYTGIPVPKNLRIQYDTLKQIASVSWDQTDSARTKGYNLYRRHQDSSFVKINGSLLTSPAFMDSSLIQDASYEYKVTVVDKDDDEGAKSAGDSVSVVSSYVLAGSFGSKGSGDGQFEAPEGIAIDHLGNVYVIDRDQHRIVRFKDDGSFAGNIQPTGWNALPNDVQFIDLAIDSSDYIYISEYNSLRVVYKVDTSNVVLDTITTILPPRNIFVDDAQNLWIANGSPEAILKVGPDGVLLDSFPAAYNYISSYPGIAVDSNGNIYTNNDSAIVKFSNTGIFTKSFSKVGRIRGIALASNGNLFICDEQRVIVFDTEGNMLLRFQLRDASGILPVDIAVSGTNDVFITDNSGVYGTGQNRVLKYTPR
jgi:hypothetical protein